MTSTERKKAPFSDDSYRQRFEGDHSMTWLLFWLLKLRAGAGERVGGAV
jgi:hypothetical protein